ncbi:MAG: hypothetical protein HY318_06830, partial [Armatimonadetes bacterium]|nr:hypothetical protein [Armatimonadota bacterium]
RGVILISDVVSLADKCLVNPDNPNLWRGVPYTTGGFSGVMLGCGPGPKPVPITVKLNVKGWYRVWVSLFSFCHTGSLRLRLSGDLCSYPVSPPARAQSDLYSESAALHETWWCDAELTGQTLIVEPSFSTGELKGCALAFLRMEPIRPPKTIKPRNVRHPLVVTNDGHGIFGERPHFRPEDMLEPFERIPEHTCLRMLIWGIGDGDMCNYPTKVGNFFPTQGRFLAADHRTLYGNMALWRKQGWDSLKLMRDYTRRRKWELQTYIRMEAFDAPYPFDKTSLHSRFFHRHPEFHCFDSHGQRVMRLSYAYPEVQAHILALIKEIAGYEPDGVCLGLIRGVPLVLYERPMVAGFMKRYGADPRDLPETDARWMAYQASVLTPFVEKAKVCLNPGQRLSVIVPGNELDCRRWGLDVATWVKEGLIDDLLPTGQCFTENDVHRDDPKSLDFDYVNRLDGRKNIRLIPLLYPWELFSSDYKAWQDNVYSYLDRGADMYAAWDSTPHGDGSNFVKVDVGYADRVELKPPTPPPVGRRVKLTTLEGFRCDRYHYYEVV